MDQVVSNEPEISEAERARRQKPIDYACVSVRLEGLILLPEVEELDRRNVAGEITSDDHSEGVPNRYQ